MVAFSEELSLEWSELRKSMKEERVAFDQSYRDRNPGHDCESKVYAYNGEWFCNHLARARNRHFKKKIDRIEEILCSMVHKPLGERSRTIKQEGHS